MSKTLLKITASLTLFAFLLQTALPREILAQPIPHFSPESSSLQELNISLPEKLGKITEQHYGTGPLVFHLQTAHGNYEAQKQIEAILKYLKKQYGVKTLLVEGSDTELQPELLRFFPKNMELTLKIADDLAHKAYVKGPELFLAGERDAKAYGIEDTADYLANKESFIRVLAQKEKGGLFLKEWQERLHREGRSILNPELRAFVKQRESFEAGHLSWLDWLQYLERRAKESLAIDLDAPESQLDRPMLFRLFRLKKFETRMDAEAFKKERRKFKKFFPRFPKEMRSQLRKFLNASVDRQTRALGDPGTELFFESMVSYLPQDFRFEDYPNLTCFIGHLILESELDGNLLMEEVSRLTDRLVQKITLTEKEKQWLELREDGEQLQKLLSLQLTAEEYETLQTKKERLSPPVMSARLASLDEKKKGADVLSEGTVLEMESLFNEALEFYRGTRARDRSMLNRIEERLASNKLDKVAVITGGFHAGPFSRYFRSKNYNYVMIKPAIHEAGGEDAYLETMLGTRASAKDTKRATLETVFFGTSSFRDQERLRVDYFGKVAPVFLSSLVTGILRNGDAGSLKDPALGTILNATSWARQFPADASARSLSFSDGKVLFNALGTSSAFTVGTIKRVSAASLGTLEELADRIFKDQFKPANASMSRKNQYRPSEVLAFLRVLMEVYQEGEDVHAYEFQTRMVQALKKREETKFFKTEFQVEMHLSRVEKVISVPDFIDQYKPKPKTARSVSSKAKKTPLPTKLMQKLMDKLLLGQTAPSPEEDLRKVYRTYYNLGKGSETPTADRLSQVSGVARRDIPKILEFLERRFSETGYEPMSTLVLASSLGQEKRKGKGKGSEYLNRRNFLRAAIFGTVVVGGAAAYRPVKKWMLNEGVEEVRAVDLRETWKNKDIRWDDRTRGRLLDDAELSFTLNQVFLSLNGSLASNDRARLDSIREIRLEDVRNHAGEPAVLISIRVREGDPLFGAMIVRLGDSKRQDLQNMQDEIFGAPYQEHRQFARMLPIWARVLMLALPILGIIIAGILYLKRRPPVEWKRSGTTDREADRARVRSSMKNRTEPKEPGSSAESLGKETALRLPLRAVVFDWDGTLSDSHLISDQVDINILNYLALKARPVPGSARRAMEKRILKKFHSILFATQGVPAAESFMKYYLTILREEGITLDRRQIRDLLIEYGRSLKFKGEFGEHFQKELALYPRMKMQDVFGHMKSFLVANQTSEEGILYLAAARSSLRYFLKRGLPVYIMTAIPDEFLEQRIPAGIWRAIEKSGGEVIGGDRSKVTSMKRLTEKYGKGRILSIGDGFGEAQAAHRTGQIFIAIARDEKMKGKMASYKPHLVIEDLKGFTRWAGRNLKYAASSLGQGSEPDAFQEHLRGYVRFLGEPSLLPPAVQVEPIDTPFEKLSASGLTADAVRQAAQSILDKLQEWPYGFLQIYYGDIPQLEAVFTDTRLVEAFRELKERHEIQMLLIPHDEDLRTGALRPFSPLLMELGIATLPYDPKVLDTILNVDSGPEEKGKTAGSSLGKLTREMKILFYGPRNETLPASFLGLERSTLIAILGNLGINIPRDEKGTVSPVFQLSAAEREALGKVLGVLPSRNSVSPRGLFVHRKVDPREKAEDFQLLFLLAGLDPSLKLTLWLSGEKVSVDRLLNELPPYIYSLLGSQPENLKIERAPLNLGRTLHEWISQEKLPAGLVAEEALFENISFRHGLLLAKVLSNDAAIAHLTAALLSRQLLDFDRGKLDTHIYTGEELAAGALNWSQLLTDLENWSSAQKVLLAAA